MRYKTDSSSWYSIDGKGNMVKNGQVREEGGQGFEYLGMVDSQEANVLIASHPMAQSALSRSHLAFDIYRKGDLCVEELDFENVKNCLDQGVALAFINDAPGVEKLVITTRVTGFEE